MLRHDDCPDTAAAGTDNTGSTVSSAPAAAAERPLDHWYGFVVAVIVFLCQFGIYGSINSYSVFAHEISEDATVGKPSATAISLGNSIANGMGSALAMLAGAVYDRHGPRLVLFAACAFTSAGWLLAGVAPNAIALILLFSVPGCIGSAFLASGGAAVSGWLDKRLSLGMGIAYSGDGAGSSIIVPLAGLLVPHFGWRASFRFLAIAPGIGLIASLFLVPRVKPQPRPPMSPLERRFLAAMLRSRSFWTLWASGVLFSFAFFAAMYVIVPFASSYGKAGTFYAKYAAIDVATASTLFTFFGVFKWLGSVALGGVAHRTEARLVYGTSCGLLGITMCLWPLSTTYIQLAAGAAATGFGFAGLFATYPAMAATCYAGRYVGLAIGATTTSLGVGGLAGPPVVIAIKAASGGSWTGSFGVMGLAAVASGAVCLIGGAGGALRHQAFSVDPVDPDAEEDPFFPELNGPGSDSP